MFCSELVAANRPDCAYSTAAGKLGPYWTRGFVLSGIIECVNTASTRLARVAARQCSLRAQWTTRTQLQCRHWNASRVALWSLQKRWASAFARRFDSQFYRPHLTHMSLRASVSRDGMSDSERVKAAAYRLHAAHCAEMAQRAADHEGRASLVMMSSAWLQLAELVEKNSES